MMVLQPQQGQPTYQMMGWVVMMAIMAMIGAMMRQVAREALTAPETRRYSPQTIPGSKAEIRYLLEMHTTVESWGKPCISNLASLMGQPVPVTREEKARLIREAEQYVKGSAYQPQTRSEPTDDEMHLPEPGPVSQREVEALKNSVLKSMKKWLQERDLAETISGINECSGTFRQDFFNKMGADLEAVCRVIDGWLEREEGAIPLVRWAGLAMCTGSAPPLLEYDERAFGFLDTELGVSQATFLNSMLAEQAFTESVLDGAGIRTLTVWRGLTGKPSERILHHVNRYGSATVKTHCGSSWSLSRNNATAFALPGAVVRHTTSRRNILSTGVSNGRFGQGYEAEVILFCPPEIQVGPDQVERVR